MTEGLPSRPLPTQARPPRCSSSSATQADSSRLAGGPVWVAAARSGFRSRLDKIGVAALAAVVTLSGCVTGEIVRLDGFLDSPRGATPAGRIQLRWQRRLVPEYEGPYLPIERAVPVLDPRNDRIYVGSSQGALWSFTGAGTEVWAYQAGGGIGSQPYLDSARDEIYVASDDGLMHALVASTGAVRWQAELEGAVGRPPVASSDSIYVITDSDVVMALDRATGQSLWRYRREAPEGFYVTEHAGMALSDRQLITGFTDGVAVALDPRDGSILWERDTSGDVEQTTDVVRFTDVDTTPVVIGETVYLASFAGGLYALERGSGSVRWLREEITGVVGIAEAPGGLLILSSGDLGVMAVRQRDGEPVWVTPVRRGAPTAPLLAGDMIVVGESEGGLVSLSLGHGTELGRVENGHGFAAPMAAASGLGAVVSNAGGLFVFALR